MKSIEDPSEDSSDDFLDCLMNVFTFVLPVNTFFLEVATWVHMELGPASDLMLSMVTNNLPNQFF